MQRLLFSVGTYCPTTKAVMHKREKESDLTESNNKHPKRQTSTILSQRNTKAAVKAIDYTMITDRLGKAVGATTVNQTFQFSATVVQLCSQTDSYLYVESSCICLMICISFILVFTMTIERMSQGQFQQSGRTSTISL